MDKIRYLKLKNAGAFVVHMVIIWDGDDGNGNESHGTYEPSGYHDICAAAERTIDLNDNTKIPNGATVKLKADVVWGKDKTASEEYIYDNSCGGIAEYKISGTTLNNKLKLETYR
ncbi:MAG: hypothetical protein WC900_02675 [Oscillospiraceae bacterium]|jgi:hypothetical protein